MSKRFIFILIFISFITTGVFGMLLVSQHHHEVGCPFMPGEKVMCEMSVVDHLSTWRTIFVATLPTLFVFAAIIFVVNFVLKIFNVSDPPCIEWWRFKRRESQSRYIGFILTGTLNPRAP